MKRNRATYWWLLAGPLVALAAILWKAWPYLAITAPSGSKVLVVEGWMLPAALREAAQLVQDSGYTQVYTTGTVRPFAYYLEPDQGLTALLDGPLNGALEVQASGVPGAGFLLIADRDTLLNQATDPVPQTFHCTVAHAATRIRVVAWPMQLQRGTPELFIGAMKLNGMNINLLLRHSWFTRPDAVAQPAWPTYAQSARDALIRMGVPAGMITAVPAYGMPRSRSWGNAHAFGIQARRDDLSAFDVATVGVHARRSRNLFQQAVGPDVRVGVIALTDPRCTRSNWWKSFRGWYTLLKEVIGVPEPQAVELAR